MSPTARFFRSSPADVFPALCVVGIVTFQLWTFFYFRSLSLGILAPAFVLVAFGYWWNLQCLSHNFIHNPFFRWQWLNRAFSVLETLAIGMPHVCYHHYHLNHHFGDNDHKGPDGTTRDWSSIYRHSKNDQAEPFWRYVLIGYWRAEVGPLFRVIIRHGRAEVYQCIVEACVLGCFWGVMAWYDFWYFVCFYLPSYYVGWMLSYAEGYLEHYPTEPSNPFANSVSSYNWLYNLISFNNGYHQEHHWDPKCHWTRMREVHEEIKDDLVRNGTTVIHGPHLTSLLELWWFGQAKNPAREGQAPGKKIPPPLPPSARKAA
jgi:fatty acid desaturase